VITCRLKITFLHDCIEHDITPRHISDFLTKDIILFDHRSIKYFKRLKKVFVRRLLNTELRDSYRLLRFTQVQLFKTCRAIYRDIPVSVWEVFFSKQLGPLRTFSYKERAKFNKKFKHLLSKTDTNVSDIEHIHYFCHIPSHYQTTTTERRPIPKFYLKGGRPARTFNFCIFFCFKNSFTT